MAWDHLAIDKPHLVYIVLGGFTTLFMLVSSIIKERLYIGEATVATLVGLIFGPHAADLINPFEWGNTDKITLEFSRIVLVVQCFAVGVELPRHYMEKHWRSVVFLLVPVMTVGWLLTSLFIWGLMGDRLNWLDSLVIAACVTATDPVLASSVVGKGKFAKRVPKHLRDLLSAESGCNDGMAFPFVYLALYIKRYEHHAAEVAKEWICITILYECIFGAVYGVCIGYAARRAIRYAHERDMIDRESFLVFYFVLALFCAGSGSILGLDDLLVGFACGVGFSNDGWFTEKTEETHVSNVIDLLINLAFFVYFGTIIPWPLYNSPETLGTSPWRLVVIAILVMLLRRIPIMMALKPVIPDIKTWREALFAGHFGPIGVGAIFVAILARAELETDSTSPLAELPPPGTPFDNIIELIWPITTFLVLTSIIIHGSSIAVFTLGKHINTLTITMSYTQANEESGNWMDRLPRIQSRSKSSMSMKKPGESDDSLEEKMVETSTGTFHFPRGFLRRQKEDESGSRARSRGSRRAASKSSNGHGGFIAPSAIRPQASKDGSLASDSDGLQRSESDTIAAQSSQASPNSAEGMPREEVEEIEETEEGGRGRRAAREKGAADEPEEEVYQEGNDTIIEDEEGNVLEVMKDTKKEPEEQRNQDIEREVRRLMSDDDIHHGVARHFDDNEERSARPQASRGNSKESTQASAKPEIETATPPGSSKRTSWKGFRSQLSKYKMREEQPKSATERKSGPARAFRFGRTIIVEDEDGEVIKKYEIPAPERNELERKQSWVDPERSKQRISRMGRLMGLTGQGDDGEDAGEGSSSRPRPLRAFSERITGHRDQAESDDRGIRFTVDGTSRRMSKAEFIQQIQALDPRSRAEVIQSSNAPEAVKEEAEADVNEHKEAEKNRKRALGKTEGEHVARVQAVRGDEKVPDARIEKTGRGQARGNDGMALVNDEGDAIPMHSVSEDLKNHAASSGAETAAARRRRALANLPRRQESPQRDINPDDSDSEDDGTERIPPSARRRMAGGQRVDSTGGQHSKTPAPLDRRRESNANRPSLDDDEETAAERRRREGALGISKEDSESEEDSQPQATGSRGIRFADQVWPRTA